MKLLAILFLAAAAAAGPAHQSGKVISFDVQQYFKKGSKKKAKNEIVYKVQIGSMIYKITNGGTKRKFSAGEVVECRVDKKHLYMENAKGKESKFAIVGEESSP